MSLGSITAVVFAKEPVPGRVKTRLVRPDGFDPGTAAEIAAAMLRCTLERLAERGRVVVAASPDGSGPRLARAAARPGLEVVDQGTGDLGARIERVWRHVDGTGPVALFGIDSPDVPADAVAAIEPALAAADAVVGPTFDGGYWTLAARRCRPELLADVDWGSDRVYDQTVQRADTAGLSVRSLTPWFDVDDPIDVEALRTRLAGEPTRDRALRTLAERLDALCGPRRAR